MVPVEFNGTFYDGHSSRPHDVLVRWVGDGIDVLFGTGQDVVTRRYASKDVVVSARLGDTARSITLAEGAKIETTDNGAADRLRAGLGAGRWSVHRLESSWSMALAAVGVLALVGTVGLLWGVPWAAKKVAASMPPELVHDMGKGTLSVLDEVLFQPSELSDGRQHAVAAGFARLADGYPDLPLELEFRKVGAPNAFALPNGTVIVSDALVDLAADDEEILAVLAHEIGHVEHRHTLRLALESSAVALFAMAYLGDASEFSTVVAALPSIYASPRFSQAHELEADAFAFDYMERVGLPPEKFAQILERLTEQSGGDVDGVARYLVSHPATAERVARFRADGG